MKKLLTLIAPFILMLTGCVEDVSTSGNDNENTEISSLSFGQEGDLFYYNFDEKVYVTQSTNQVFLKFAPDATEEQFRAIAESNTLSQKVNQNGELHFTRGGNFNTLTLEVPQFSDVLKSFKARQEVVSATYLLENNGYLTAYTDEFSVKLKKGVTFAKLQELSKNNNCTISEHEEFGENEFMITVPKTSELGVIRMASMFYETGIFEFTTPNFVRFNTPSSYDPHFSSQWGLKNTGQYGSSTTGIDIGVEQAWTITQGDSDVKIAIIDFGVDLEHPDLQTNLLSGYDATGGSSAGGPSAYDVDAHGTAVAGIAGAIKDNMAGISGVAPLCKIIPIRVGINNSIQDSWAIKAINWASTRADVINCSWGGDPAYSNPQLTAAIGNAITNGRVVNSVAKGCVVVFATGNENRSTISYPANCNSNIIAVGAISYDGNRKKPGAPDGEGWGSNYGMGLDVVAPGVLIPTTDMLSNAGYNIPHDPYVHGIHPDAGGNKKSNDFTDRNYTVWFNGTSAAAPHVAGIAALMLSKYPNLTQQQVANIITSTASNNNSWNNQTGYGRVNAHKAVLGHLSIFGQAYPTLNIDYSYLADPITLPTGVTFNNWTITPSGYTVTGGVNSRSMIIKFTTLSNYTLTANYRLPDNTIYSVSKTIQPQAVPPPVPTLMVTSSVPPVTLMVTNHQTGQNYEWYVNGGSVGYNSNGQVQIHPYSGSPEVIVVCRALIGNLASIFCNPITVPVDWQSASAEEEQAEELQQEQQSATGEI